MRAEGAPGAARSAVRPVLEPQLTTGSRVRVDLGGVRCRPRRTAVFRYFYNETTASAPPKSPHRRGPNPARAPTLARSARELL